MKDEDAYERVYALVRMIPRGRVTSYGAVAAAIGSKGGARLVGWALNQLGSTARQHDVPAHRVLNRNGLLSGRHHFGPPGMQAMLEAEGIEVKEDQVLDFANLYWDPLNEVGPTF